MNKSATHLLAASLITIGTSALAAPANQPAPAPAAPANTILPIGVAKTGVASTAWFVDVSANQAIGCDAAAKTCTHIIIPQEPNSPSNYVPIGVEVFGSGTGAWLVDTNNKQAIVCVHNQMRKDCTRMPYWP